MNSYSQREFSSDRFNRKWTIFELTKTSRLDETVASDETVDSDEMVSQIRQ